MKRPIYAILAGALLIRMVAAFYLGNEVSGLSGAHDEISYSMLGHRFADGFGLTFPDNWYPWIKANSPQSYFSASMSLLLAGIYAVFGYNPLIARVIMGILSVGVLWIIYLLSSRLFGERIGLVSAVIGSQYSYLIFYGVTLVTETPFILAVLSAIYLSLQVIERPKPSNWILLGMALTAAILLRMAVVFYVPALLAWILWRRKEWSTWILAPIAIMASAVFPFSWRNYQLWNEFALLETQFGHVFWNGNHPGHNGDFHPYEVFPIPDEVLALNNDVLITRALLARGIETVIGDPGHFVLLTVTRLREFFKFWPTPDTSLLGNTLRVCSFGLMWPFALVGLYLCRRRWREVAPILLFIVIHTSVYALMWTMIRYRIPLDAVLIPFAAVAGDASYRYVADRVRRGQGDRAS